MSEINYSACAGLYAGKSLRRNKGPRYRRFETVAEALRYAIEDMPGSQLRGSVLEVDEQRFDEKQIRMLYNSPKYPLPRASE